VEEGVEDTDEASNVDPTMWLVQNVGVYRFAFTLSWSTHQLHLDIFDGACFCSLFRD
jgi:hypothetical protein